MGLGGHVVVVFKFVAFLKVTNKWDVRERC